MIDETMLNKILNEIFELNNPSIDKTRRPQISEFIKSTTNGDVPADYLVINCILRKNRNGALVYILTDLRLLKIEIDEKNISSSSPSLGSIINIDKKLQENNRAHIAIDFQNDHFGLSYAANNQIINDFFQKVDLARTRVKS